MDYYDFYNGIKQVISQVGYNRLLLVKYKKTIVIVDEYELDGLYKERCRIRLTKEQIRRLNEMV